MAGFLRFLIGILLLPACWASVRACVEILSRTGSISITSFAFVGGLIAFLLCWATLPHPTKAYVLGHELTHALCGLLFGARPSHLRVKATGGSVDLTKTNLLITLSPYFFPFYTFLCVVAIGIAACFIQPLPYTWLWVFLIGFTWAFHVTFTLESLAQHQPDIVIYGHLFSWTFIFIANVFVILIGLGFATDCSWRMILGIIWDSLTAVYRCLWHSGVQLIGLFNS